MGYSGCVMNNIRRFLVVLLIIGLHVSARRLTRRVILERLEEKYMNKEYADVIVQMKKPDRRTFSLNITINLYKDINNWRVFGQIYKFADNLYKETALRYESDACVYMETLQASMFQTDNEVFNHFLQRCPIKKVGKAEHSWTTVKSPRMWLPLQGTYWVHNVNETLVNVPFIPLWRGMLDYSFNINNNQTLLYHAQVYFQIKEV